MIPSVLSKQVKDGVEDFLRTTFPESTPFFHGLLDRFLAEEGNFFKGPYFSVQLPFRQGQGGPDFFPDVPLRFQPHLHQEKAFKRLSGKKIQSTIVATGTGSGKTESFLTPILDYCLKQSGQPGIKAILIYPMNALAADQAERLARTIWDNPKLKGKVRAGLFVGQREKEPAREMSRDRLISHHESMHLNPPDILLTNYKMLDYLLVRPKDLPLWKGNKPETLRFLTVDELHTFDGAQGTDLACLIRRIKARLQTPQEHLCCIGTSATLGSDGEQKGLLKYAEEVFAEPFSADAIISEERISVSEFLGDAEVEFQTGVGEADAGFLAPNAYETHEKFIQAQAKAWVSLEIPDAAYQASDWRVDLGLRLKRSRHFQELLRALAGHALTVNELQESWYKRLGEAWPALDSFRIERLNSLLALVSEAKTASEGKKARFTEQDLRPFVNIRIQVWFRELRRMVGEIKENPRLRFSDDLNDEQKAQHLPIVHCRECGSMGWVGVMPGHGKHVSAELRPIYEEYFGKGLNIQFLFADDVPKGDEEDEQRLRLICGKCLTLSDDPEGASCPSCGETQVVKVFVPKVRIIQDNRTGHQHCEHRCPYCGGSSGLNLLGSQSASLTSVLISQLFSSGHNDDKKLLTFSDSVQDAAHRAGFFSARTYRFNLRAAIQQYVAAEGATKSLAELPAGFIAYWANKFNEPRYIATFIAPDMMWFEEYDKMKREGVLPAGSKLRREVDMRLGWEIFSEYGFNSRIGRTLEKSSASTAFVDPKMLEAVTGPIHELLTNEAEVLRAMPLKSLERLLHGILLHIRSKGAVSHDGLASFIQDGGNYFLINKIPWMPRFGKRSRVPNFPGFLQRRNDRFDRIITKGGSSWFEVWAEKTLLQSCPMVSSVYERLYEVIFDGLTRGQILEQRETPIGKVYGLRPEAVRVSCSVVQLRCDDCGHWVSIPEQQSAIWDGETCTRRFCRGLYHLAPKTRDYYGELYSRGDIERIFAAEHTGLLERDDRQDLETRFKKSEVLRDPWDENLLSCTPTLELGIDIGDLSSVVLCSVPPTQASYVQRVGRAGRKDGNALNVTVAAGKPHDLFFFAQPKEMIAGRVEAPGLFLRASAVLERQLIAFCLDKWVETGLSKGQLPDKLRAVLNDIDNHVTTGFPHNFLKFIKEREAVLGESFLALFPELPKESADHLKVFLGQAPEGGAGLEYRLVNSLTAVAQDRKSLKTKIGKLSERLRRMRTDPARGADFEDELREAKQEKEGLVKVVARINERDIFNVLTDEGLIPNYAFPEEGVILRSIIFRKKEHAEGKDRKYDTWEFEYERPAATAISELAPANWFYAGGRKVQIDQIDLDVSEVEDWRFCKRCSHSQMEEDGGPEKCPLCGDSEWRDAGQKRPMLRIRQVFANTSDRESRIDDGSDSRDRTFYQKQMLVAFKQSDVTDAFHIDSEHLPFGFEFLARAVFREVNFGEKDEDADLVKIAGQQLPRKGFSLCRDCGKIKTDKEIKHSFTCPQRKKDGDPLMTGAMYLYRELHSEAIRILLPETTMSLGDRKLHSLVAALQLGLKKKFGGSIDHLQVATQHEPVENSEQDKKFLVLYDSVPGGTGYLKDLMRSEAPLFDVFRLAYEALVSCECNADPGKDGCYRCLFAYRNSYDMPQTSRNAAIELLRDVLNQRAKLKRIKKLSDVKVNALFDSELEGRFIDALSRVGVDQDPVLLRKEVVRGKPGFYLKIGAQAYQIEQQVSLNDNYGIKVPSLADFVFHPLNNPTAKPLVVFTDGWEYHWNRISTDFAQRMAILASGKFHVWSIIWKDVEPARGGGNNYFADLFDVSGAPNGRALGALLGQMGLAARLNDHQKNSFDLLRQFLKNPDHEAWGKYAWALSLTQVGPAVLKADWLKGVSERFPAPLNERLEMDDEDSLFGVRAFEELVGKERAHIFYRVAKAAVGLGDRSKISLGLVLDDDESVVRKIEFLRLWAGALRFLNVMQFLPNALFTTTAGIEDGAFDEVPEARGATVPGVAPSDGWDEVLELVEGKSLALAKLLRSAGVRIPVIGLELKDGDMIVAQAEFGWEAEKVAVVEDGNTAAQKSFEQKGWIVFTIPGAISSPDALLKKLRGGTNP